ncbi:MAG: hypothetical protein EOM52_00740 [Clostridia bacterium]|nr:hypothetical protein [Clostridia bacterium]
MDAKSQVTGLLFGAVSRARREAVRKELEIHGFEELEDAALPCILDGEDTAPDDEETERLYRVCRVVDSKMLAGFEPEEQEILAAYFRRMMRNLRGESILLC